MDRRAVQAALRGWFARWGLPAQLRVDNGPPWGSWGDLPPELALWLLGLGVEVVWNRPRHSQGNAVVERAHGVCQRWVEPGTCRDAAALQARLDHFTALQRERYPAVAGRSRLEAYPALAAGGRPYDPGREARQWEERRVWDALAARAWRRRVDKVGRISVYNRALGVGRRWARSEVTVQLAVRRAGPAWVVRAADGTPIRERAAPELRRGRVRALAVTHRPPHPADRTKPDVRHGA